jgi:hypothetical protein
MEDGNKSRGRGLIKHTLLDEADEKTGEVLHTVEVLFEPGAVVELRAIKGRETVSGYFDDHLLLAREANKLEDRGYSVYVTLNEVDSALLARASNRARKLYKEPTTSDSDVMRRRWLPLDFDPARPSGVSATDAEKKTARLRAIEVREFLKGLCWPEPVVGDSGNGYHLLYRIDLPNDQESLELVKGVLEALAFKFSDEAVGVDTTTCNAARIWKLYGTTARKGDDTGERPHRRSGLLKVTDGSGSTEGVGREKLEAVAAMRPSPPPREEPRFGPGRNGYREFDLEAWIEEHDVPVKREGPWQRDGYRWVLQECPWNGHTDNAAYIVRHPSGAAAAGCHHSSYQGYGWRDLRDHYEPDCYQRNRHQEATNEAGAVVEEWEPPAPLPDGLPPVDTFDPVMLPECLRGWLEDIAKRMQVPLDYLAAGAMVVVGSLVGRKVGIYPKRRDDWIVVPNLWGMIVGRSALLKSPALAEVMKPLGRLIADAHEAHNEELAEYEIETMVAEAEAKALKKTMEKLASEAAKTGDRSELVEAARREGVKEPEPPTLRRYKTEDATVEKIGELLVENPQGILNHRDELSGWFRSLEKQGREGDRAFYLESWNGTGSFDVDRIGRGSLHIPALCLSILGGIQPGPLSSYVCQAVQGQQGADGLLQRFQLTVWPDPPKSWRNVDRYPDAEAKNRVYEVFKTLDSLKVNEAATDEEVPALRFDSQAQEVFDTWRDVLEQRLRSEEMAPALEAHIAKYRSLMPSLALLFELIDTEGLPVSVGKLAAVRAVAWCEYLETHAGRLYASTEKPAMEGARALLERIRKGDVKDGSSARDIYRGRHWSKLSTAEEVNAAAVVLEDYGWLRVEKLETGGRPSTRIRLHPTLRGPAKEVE